MNLRKRLLNLASPILQPLAKWYLSKPRTYRYKGIVVKILPGVFHPGFFFSTKILIQYVTKLSLQKKKVLELGAGSGLLSIFCAKQGAFVLASDINPTALKAIQQSAKANHLTIDSIESNLFERIDPNDFDLILINPPYFPKDPATIEEEAWFCGASFEYFHKLFSELNKKLLRSDNQIVMILSEDCQTKTIFNIASEYGIYESLIHETKPWGERNFIYSLKK